MRRLVSRLALTVAGAAAVISLAKLTPLPRMAADAAVRTEAALVDLSSTMGFRLGALTVEGRAMTTREDLLGALDAEPGTPIVVIDVSRARAKVEALPWVKSAKIERRLPGTIHIKLEERLPYALWQRDGRYTLVDHEGHLIVDVPAAEFQLPLIVGADAPAHAAVLFETLRAEPDLARRVQAAVRVGARRWNIHFDSYENGISVRLPEDNIKDAWARLAALDRDHKILERDLEFIDLRFKDQLIVRLRKTHSEEMPTAAGTSSVPAVPVKQSL